MYLGKIVEIGERDTIFDSCLHPYTKALMSAIPVADPDMKTQFIPLEGEVPDLMDPPANCLFCSRCPYADDHCRTNIPELREISPHHYVACHHV